MDCYPICSPPALLRVEHEDVVLCLALAKWKPFHSHGCCPFADVSAAEMWCCSVDQALWAGADSVSAGRKGAAVVVTPRPQLLPRWSSRSLLGEKLLAVQTSDLLESRSCLDSSPCSLLPLCRTKGAFATVSGVLARGLLQGSTAAFALSWSRFHQHVRVISAGPCSAILPAPGLEVRVAFLPSSLTLFSSLSLLQAPP